ALILIVLCFVVLSCEFERNGRAGLLKHLIDSGPISLLGKRLQVLEPLDRYTESCPSLLFEGIDVINLPKNIEPPASLAWCLKNLNHLVLCKSSLGERVTLNGKTWWQNNAPGASYPGQIRESEIWWKWMMLQPYYRGL